MKQLNQIYCLFTPFHKLALDHVFPEWASDDCGKVLFYSEFLHSPVPVDSDIESVLIDSEFTFSSNFFYNPVRLNNRIKSIRSFIISTLIKYKISDSLTLVAGSDHILFNQIMISVCRDLYTNCRVIIIDEGLGFYTDRKLVDYLKIVFFNLYSFLFLKIRIYFIKPLGTHPRVTDVFLRFPERITVRRKGISYHRFEINYSQEGNFNFKRKFRRILIFSTPEDFIGLNKKVSVIQEIITRFISYGCQIDIKPHPREVHDFFEYASMSSVHVMSRHLVGEQLNYFEYDYVFNFCSSIVMDIIQLGYPGKKVFTLYTLETKKLLYLFKETNFVSIEDIREVKFYLQD